MENSLPTIPGYIAGRPGEADIYVGEFQEAEIYYKVRHGQAKLRRHGKVRRAYLNIQPPDLTTFDLKNRMLKSRKTVYRQVLDDTGHFTWSHKLRGPALDLWQAIAVEELRADGVLKNP